MKNLRFSIVLGVCASFLLLSQPALSSGQFVEDGLDSEEGGAAFYEVDISIYAAPNLFQPGESFVSLVNFPGEGKYVSIEFFIENRSVTPAKFLMTPGENPDLEIKDSVGNDAFGNLYCNLEGGSLSVLPVNPVSIMKISGSELTHKLEVYSLFHDNSSRQSLLTD